MTYFKDQGILSAGLSEWTVTVIWSAMLIGRLLYAFVLPSSSRLRSLFLISCACIVTYSMLLFSSSGIAALVSLFLFGMSISGCYPIAIATANKTLSNASVGVLLPVAGIGAIVMPYITGAVAQEVGHSRRNDVLVCSHRHHAGFLLSHAPFSEHIKNALRFRIAEHFLFSRSLSILFGAIDSDSQQKRHHAQHGHDQ